MIRSPSRVLVTDFDGTMTRYDFYELVVSKLLPAGTPDYWAKYRDGEITHFEALRRYFAAIRVDETALLQVVSEMEIDPLVATSVKRLREHGWTIVVASAGCRWYIDHLLSQAGIDLEVHASPGQFRLGDGLVMEMPVDSPFHSPTHGIDKAEVVRHYRATATQIAFAGDGYPDVEAARLVPASQRFARGNLAQVLSETGEPFIPFAVWSDVACQLTASERTQP